MVHSCSNNWLTLGKVQVAARFEFLWRLLVEVAFSVIGCGREPTDLDIDSFVRGAIVPLQIPTILCFPTELAYALKALLAEERGVMGCRSPLLRLLDRRHSCCSSFLLLLLVLALGTLS